MLTTLLTLLFEVKQILPLENALTFGLAIFALSWVRPRRIVSLPERGFRHTVLRWAGTAGAVAIVAAATLASALNVGVYDASGYDGWWRRPAPLVVATLLIVIAALALRRVPVPAPGERAITPLRAWNTFAPRVSLWIAGIAASLALVTATWQIASATTAPENGQFFGHVPDYSPLPIYTNFNNGFGYVSGSGWPNHLATVIVILLAALTLVLVLRTDANRPILARSTAPSVRPDRESTARVFTLLMLAGLTATLGAVWMHVGSAGTSLVGIDEYWVSENVSNTRLFIDGGYSAIARPMNLAGYALQGAGVALALRIAVDTVRAALATRTRSDVDVEFAGSGR
ncbi:hypothetical protein [Plantibacter sp. CFBP 13570]|uniref:hypothetical protein n=1 Tax=Plantibacter sp. CFBP 13570 TaxID=2775272 RepID=UPI001930D57D|nr:hypothetical protein [Plantibacter sp. CFBP 13570]MBD8533641.1 hypothetical protein [Plantibacter sp. CFBP 13570]